MNGQTGGQTGRMMTKRRQRYRRPCLRRARLCPDLQRCRFDGFSACIEPLPALHRPHERLIRRRGV